MKQVEYFSNVMKNKIDDNFNQIEELLGGLATGETAVFELKMSVEFDNGFLVPSGGFTCQKKMRALKDSIDQEPFNPDQPDMFEEEK